MGWISVEGNHSRSLASSDYPVKTILPKQPKPTEIICAETATTESRNFFVTILNLDNKGHEPTTEHRGDAYVGCLVQQLHTSGGGGPRAENA